MLPRLHFQPTAHSPTLGTSGRGGRMGLLISNKWKYNQLLPNAKYNTLNTLETVEMTVDFRSTNLRAAERKWHKSKDPEDLTKFQALLSSFSSSGTDAKKAFCIDNIHSNTDTQKLQNST